MSILRDHINEVIDTLLDGAEDPVAVADMIRDSVDTAAGSQRAALSVNINDADAVVLRAHIRDAHKSLLDSVVDGPLPEDLDEVPNDVLAAIHTANHMVPWHQHPIDVWRILPPTENTTS